MDLKFPPKPVKIDPVVKGKAVVPQGNITFDDYEMDDDDLDDYEIDDDDLDDYEIDDDDDLDDYEIDDNDLDWRSNDFVVEALSEILTEKSFCKHQDFPSGSSETFRGSGSHLSVVQKYVLRLCLNSDSKVLHSAHLFNNKSLWHQKNPTQAHRELLASFTQELQELFLVPRLDQLFDTDKTLKKNEIIASFIDFLLQLLYYESEDFTVSGIDNLVKELKFLVAVLGDTILLCDEHEQVQNLLTEFQEVADEAGGLIYSLLFAADPISESGLAILLRHITLLKDNIIGFSADLQPFIAATPRKDVLESLFIVDSLLSDLEDLLNREGILGHYLEESWNSEDEDEDSRILEDILTVEVKDQIKILHQELMLSLSLLKCIKKVSRCPEMDDLEEAELRIRDVAYEAEFCINSFLVEDSPYFSIRLTHVIQKIKLIRSGLQNYDHGALKVTENVSSQMLVKAKRVPEVNDIIVGFDDMATDILGQLLGGRDQLQTISIFGMPGLGKTTIAKKLYTHPSINYRFDKCSWCIVSHVYQTKSLLTDILIELSNDHEKTGFLHMDEETLIEHIYKILKRRRYLIVMDDIWDSNAWGDLWRCFPDDGNGSRILFTTRNKDVVPPNSVVHALPSLSNDQCWELLEKKVFRHEPCPPRLQGIGKKIAANCHGLPLAVVVVAGILSIMDEQESTWENVGGKLASYILSDQISSITQVFELSYKHLPEHLKPCFLYFGAFTKEREIPVRKLMRFWIAEGFIRKEENRSSEGVAEEYLMELIDKSLIMVARRRSDGGVKTCIIHDLLREFCLKVSEQENFFILLDDNNCSLYEKGHRLHEEGHRLPVRQSPKDLPRSFSQHVRSFHHSWCEDTKCYVHHMKLLRVLNFEEGPSAQVIGMEYLAQLRFLVIDHIPPSIGCLVNLEFLVVTEQSKGTISLPSRIVQMKKLKHIHTSSTARYDQHHHSSKRNNLEYLSMLGIFNRKDEEMLRCSPNLRKLKCICGPSYVEAYPNLCFLTQLESLGMYNYGPLPFPTQLESLGMYNYPILPLTTLLDSLGMYNDGPLLKKPESSSNPRKQKLPDEALFRKNESIIGLEARGSPDLEAPNMINFPSNIKKLTLFGWSLPWEKMSVIGELPNLQVLKLTSSTSVGRIWETRDGEFQQLIFLKLEAKYLTQWNVDSCEHFPKLERLVVSYCRNLQEIPCEIGEIPTLQSIEVEYCRQTVEESARQIEQEQRDNGNDEPRVIVTRLEE